MAVLIVMDRATIQRLLEAAEARAREAGRRVADQRRVVVGLQQNGDLHEIAGAILQQLELSHRVLLGECDRLRRKLDEPVY